MAEDNKIEQVQTDQTDQVDENQLIAVKINKPEYHMNDTFIQLSQDIPLLVERAHQLLDQLDEENLENMDETVVTNVIRDLKEVKPFYKQVKDARDDVKRHLKKAVEVQMEGLDAQLKQTRFDELEALISKGSDIERRIRDARKESRWMELEKQFNKTLNKYPLLQQHIPHLTDFSIFKNANPKLVSAAKNASVSTTMYASITTYIGNLESDVQSILGFQSPFEEQLFAQYQLSPNLPQIVALNHSLEKKKAAEDARQKQKMEEEIKRQAAIEAKRVIEKEAAERRKRELKALEEAKAEAEKNKAIDGVETKVIIKTVEASSLASPQLKISKESRQDLAGSPFSETLESYLKKTYPDLSTDALRFDAIFKTIKAIGAQDPDVMRFIKSPTHALDAIKLLMMAEN